MRKLIFLVLVLGMAACSQQGVVDFDSDTTLTVEERVVETDEFNVINKIEDNAAVQKVIDLFKNVKWDTNKDVDMDTEPDYRLNNYDSWITPDGDKLEVINRNNSYYVRLSEEDAAVLFKIMTGEELESK